MPFCKQRREEHKRRDVDDVDVCVPLLSVRTHTSAVLATPTQQLLATLPPDANGRRWRLLLPCLLPQRTVTNSFDVDLNAILQTTVEGTREKKLNPLMSHVHAATTSPISKANATLSTNVANLDFILDTLSCRLESLEDVVEELQ